MNVRVYVTPKKGILDPQGAAVERSLPNLGFTGCLLYTSDAADE